MTFHQSLSFKYFITVSGVLSLMVVGIFVHFYRVQKEAILGEVKNQARILCRQVLLTRSWLADMGGVYVKKRVGLAANPYLGTRGEMEGIDHQRYLLRNPAMVTRELSEYAKRLGLYRFRLTSDRVINPANVPDGTERYALKLFRNGQVKEYVVRQEMAHQKVLGFECGADDYVVKPFEFLELQARIKACFRRQEGRREYSPQRVERGPLVIDRAGFQVWLSGEPVELTKKEFDLLYFLASHPDQVLSREEIRQALWGKRQLYAWSRTIDVHIQHLRQKLERDPKNPVLIVTVPGVGYRFSA